MGKARALPTEYVSYREYVRPVSEGQRVKPRLELWAKSRKKTNPAMGGMKQGVGLRVVARLSERWQFPSAIKDCENLSKTFQAWSEQKQPSPVERSGIPVKADDSEL